MVRTCPVVGGTDHFPLWYGPFATVEGSGLNPPPLTDRTCNPPYGSNPYLTAPTGRVRSPKYTCFETPQEQIFSRFAPLIGSCSQFCLILQPDRVAVPDPPTFASPWRNSFVKIHGGTTLLRAKFGTTPQKRPKNDLISGVGSCYPLHSYEIPTEILLKKKLFRPKPATP